MNITGLPLEEKQKKMLISLLLLISCIVSSVLLAFTSNLSPQSIKSFDQADSLIINDLTKFNISDQQVRIQSVAIDSVNTRKTYRVNVPPGLSKTQLHLELAQTFYPFEIQSAARIDFPQRDMTIHLIYHNSVFRSITLQSDPDLVMERNFGSILVAFESIPPDDLIDKIISFGEPIPLALIIDNPAEAGDLYKTVEDKYSRILFWLKDEEGNDVLSDTYSPPFPGLHQLREVIPNALVLSFMGFNQEHKSQNNQMISQTSFGYVDASEAILLDSQTGYAAFKQELNKFAQQAIRNEHPVAIVKGNNESLNWMQAELAGLKKAGLEIIPPRRKRF